MTKLRFFALCCLIVFQAPINAQDSSLATSNVLAPAGDTLADLYALHGGIREFQVDLGDSTWYRMGDQGQVILAQDVLEGDRLPYLDIKTKTFENEFFDNRLKVNTKNGRLTAHVSSIKIEMAFTGINSNGKIWVVIAVVFVLFLTLIGLLLYQQQSLRKWEKTQTKN